MSAAKRWDLLWRGVGFVASVFGIFSLVMFLGFIAGPSEGDVLLPAVVPLVAGLVSVMASMQARTRILMLWIASVLLTLIAILTVIYGIGVILLMVVAAYIMAAWMLNEAQNEDSTIGTIGSTTDTNRTGHDGERLPLWRSVTVIVSVVGFVGVAVVWNILDEPGPGYLALCGIPFLIGFVAAIGSMETQNRILLLWAAAAISGLVAALTIMSGAGLIILVAMIAYLLAAWNMNESEPRTAR